MQKYHAIMRLNLSAKREFSVARPIAPNPLSYREKKFSKENFATEPKNSSRTIQSQNKYKTEKMVADYWKLQRWK